MRIRYAGAESKIVLLALVRPGMYASNPTYTPGCMPPLDTPLFKPKFFEKYNLKTKAKKIASLT